MKKRIWAMALVVVLALSLVPVSAAGSLQEEEGAQWITVEGIEGGEVLFKKETGTIEKCRLTVTSANIPDTINDVPVKIIASSAFSNCGDLKSVTIPESVREIGMGAFSGCSKLEIVTFKGETTDIGSSAFSFCSNLTEVVLPTKLERIESDVFSSCSMLSQVTIPNSVISIGEGAFAGCHSISTITLPENLKKLGGGAFRECTKIEEVTIPASVSDLGGRSFAYCTNLEKVIISTKVDSITPETGEFGLFYNCPKLTSMGPIGSGCDIEFAWDEAIPWGFFGGLDNLEKVYIPETIKELSWVFFGGKLNSAGPVGSGCSIEFGWTTEIPTNAFASCISLSQVNLPEGISIIPESAFSGCSNLTSLDIPETVTTIEERAFSSTGLTGIKIPEGVSFVNDYVFYKCDHLSSVNLPDSIRGIGTSAFSDCSSLETMELPKNVSVIGTSAFRNCKQLTSITIPDEVIKIAEGTFQNCDSLKSVTIPVGVTDIENNSFQNCKSLTDIYFKGNKAVWNKISIGTGNDNLLHATIHYGDEDPVQPAEVTLTFETNGGSKINSLSVSSDTTVDLTQYVPIKEGYTFAGWYSDSKLTTAVTSLKLTADATVYAKWLPAQYTLTFETNGGSKINPLPVAADTTVDLTKYVPTKEGYAFAGWYADRNLTTQVTSLKLAADTTVYAKWLPAQYTLTFETNGGSKINALSVGAGTTVDLTQYVPVRAGYDFAGWYADRKLTTQVIFLKPTADTTVYAKWEKEAPVLLPFLDVTKSDWFYEDVAYVYENGLMNGVGEGLFGPNATTTRAMVVTILYRLEGEPAVTGDTPFTDLVAGQYYLDAVAWASTNDIVNGVTSTTFAPNDPITREQMAAILYRYAQYKGMDTTDRGNLGSFADGNTVSPYAVEAMAWANAEGLINGVENNRLNPTGQAFRSQVAAILHRFCTME